MRTTTSISDRNIVSKILFSAVGIFFMVMGALFIQQEWGALQETRAMNAWPQTECVVTACESEDHGEKFRLEIAYEYVVNDERFVGTRYGQNAFFTAEKIGEIKPAEQRFAPGTKTSCHYDPAHPADSALHVPSTKGGLSAIGFRAIFPTIGLLMAAAPWIRRRRGAEKKTKQSTGRLTVFVLGAAFTGMGLLMTNAMLIAPLQKTNAAKTWTEVPATVVSSKVKSHTNEDGTTYSPYVAYRYEFDGEEFFGDQYNFMDGSSSGHVSKAAIVRQYPIGHAFSVFVNPAAPSESVIKRETGTRLAFGLIPLVFVIIGALVLLLGFKLGKGGAPKLDPRQANQRVVALKSANRIAPLIFIILFTIIWNGIVVLIYHSGNLLFLALFGFFGLVSIWLTIKSVLTLFNPRVTAEISPGEIQPKTTVTARWTIGGRSERIRALKVTLRGRRLRTTHGSDGKSSVIKTPIYEIELLEAQKPEAIQRGAIQFIVPADQPPSRPGNENGIEWHLIFHGDISRWPDLKEEFEFTVYPDTP